MEDKFNLGREIFDGATARMLSDALRIGAGLGRYALLDPDTRPKGVKF